MTLFYLLGWLAFIGFFAMAFLKLKAYREGSPLHIRWELYPVPHEGKRAEHGGSFMEDKDWWTKEHHVDHMGDLKGMMMEAFLLHATWEHNPKLWVRSYPFHLGLYMLMGGTIILVITIFLHLGGGLLTTILNLLNAAVIIGSLLITGGAIALIHRRKTDPGLKRYTSNEHYLNLGAFALFGILGILAWLRSPNFAAMALEFMKNLLTFHFTSVGSTLFTLHMLVGFFLLIWIPMSNMAHLVMKYDMFHNIRWGDTPMRYSEENREKLMESLQFKVDWAAPHIGSNGQKTWVEVATTNPAKKDA